MGKIKQKGFTLVEIMVAIILGSFITAAAISLYLISQRTYQIQEAFLSNQNNIKVVTDILTKSIKRSASTYKGPITGKTIGGDLVLSANSFGYGAVVSKKYLFQSKTGPSFVDTPSDQIVLMYPLNAIGTNRVIDTDCEGVLNSDNTLRVIERYFVRPSKTKPESLVLACDAARYNPLTGDLIKKASDGSWNAWGEADNGIELADVDLFHVLLTIQNGGTYRDVSIEDYRNNYITYEVVAIKIGVLLHSTKSIGLKGIQDFSQRFKVLDQDVQLNATAATSDKKYTYDVVTQTIATRNASGALR